jgi:hypothetical protein
LLCPLHADYRAPDCRAQHAGAVPFFVPQRWGGPILKIVFLSVPVSGGTFPLRKVNSPIILYSKNNFIYYQIMAMGLADRNPAEWDHLKAK